MYLNLQLDRDCKDVNGVSTTQPVKEDFDDEFDDDFDAVELQVSKICHPEQTKLSVSLLNKRLIPKYLTDM